jgi:hypothetical protein
VEGRWLAVVKGLRIPLCRCYVLLQGGNTLLLFDYGGCSEMERKARSAMADASQIVDVRCEESEVVW